EGVLYKHNNSIRLRAQAVGFLCARVLRPNDTVKYDDLKQISGAHNEKLIYGLATELRRLLGDQKKKEIIQNRAGEGYGLVRAVKIFPREQLRSLLETFQRPRQSEVRPQKDLKDLKKPGERRFERSLHAWRDIKFKVLTD